MGIERDDTPPAGTPAPPGKWSKPRPEHRRETAVMRAARRTRTWWDQADKLTKDLTKLVGLLITLGGVVAGVWPSGAASPSPPPSPPPVSASADPAPPATTRDASAAAPVAASDADAAATPPPTPDPAHWYSTHGEYQPQLPEPS